MHGNFLEGCRYEYTVDNIPYSEMWPDDKYWFPLFLKCSKFSGYFKFQGHDDILEHKLEEVNCLPDPEVRL